MQNYNCKNCGATLYWETEDNCLRCKFCDSEYQISDFEDKTVSDMSTEVEELDKSYINSDTVTEDMSVYECKNCGGEVVTLNTTMATICPYCSEAISITSKSVGAFRPELCIPFKKSKEEAVKIYTDYVNQSFLTPKAFKEQHTIEKIQGLFAPFHLHDIIDRAEHSFEGEQLASRKRGYDKVTTHKIYSLKIEAEGNFEGIPIDASVRISNQLMEAVEPFNYGEIKDYNPAYMAGFMAEQMDDDKADLDERAKTRAKQGMRERAMSAFTGYSSVKTISERHNIREHKSSYTMLPVWLLNVKHGDQKYTFAVNGQTGKIVGKLPIDKLKLFLIGCGALLASDITISILAMLFG